MTVVSDCQVPVKIYYNPSSLRWEGLIMEVQPEPQLFYREWSYWIAWSRVKGEVVKQYRKSGGGYTRKVSTPIFTQTWVISSLE